ncbi:hypothetical protein ACYSNX_01240 [Myroides sp. LJL115]
MISEKLKTYLKEYGWWEEQAIEMYEGTIEELAIDKDSDFSIFYNHAEQGAPTFLSDRGFELYHIG